MIKAQDKNAVRKVRHRRVRKHISGVEARPRLNVYRSLNHIYAQIINDELGNTIVCASTLDAELKDKAKKLTKSESAKLVGELIGKRAVKAGIKQVVFDRGGYLYIGRVAQLAAGAREAGLEF